MKQPKTRPQIIPGVTEKIETGCGSLYVTVNYHDNKPFEVFAQLGKAGGCANAMTEAVSRLVALALRSDVEPAAIVKQLRGIRCPRPPQGIKHQPALSCPDAIGKVLELKSACAVPQPLIAVEMAKKVLPIETAKKEYLVQLPLPVETENTTTPYGETVWFDGGADKATKKLIAPQNHVGVCPDCGDLLWYESGCKTCHQCGWSECG